MGIKSIIFTLVILAVFVAGALVFDHFQEKVEDRTWLIVFCKIAIVMVLCVVYGLIVKWAAGLCHLEWNGI